MTLPILLAWLVILLAVPLNWLVVFRLWRLLIKRPDNRVLQERFVGGAMLAVVITIFAGIFINNGLEKPLLIVVETQVITRLTLLTLSIPAIYWLILYKDS